MVYSQRVRKRIQIQTLLAANWSIRQVARKLKCDKETVQKWKAREEASLNVEDLSRSGRPRRLNLGNRQKLARRCKGKRIRSLRNTSKWLQTQGISASKDTVHRELRRQGLRPYHRPKRPKLTRTQKAKRVEFAIARRRHDWKKTLMTDETEFRLFAAKGANTKNDVVWAHDPSEVPPREVVAFPPTVRCWGGVAAAGKTKLHFYEGNLSGKRYRAILKKAKKEMHDIFDDDDWTYGHDGAPAHGDAKTNRWLENNVPDFIRSGRNGEWPPNSPDLNWIEGIWSILADRVNQPKPPTTARGLKRKLRRVWNNLEPAILENSARSMPDRLRQVIATGGKVLKK